MYVQYKVFKIFSNFLGIISFIKYYRFVLIFGVISSRKRQNWWCYKTPGSCYKEYYLS